MDVSISVIIPAFNAAKHIDRCLYSIRQQTYPPREIIVVDDGSTDSTPEILARHAKDDLRLRIVRTENGGVSSARNTGMDRASGTHVVFVDADDQMGERGLEALFHAVTKEIDVVVGAWSTRQNAGPFSKSMREVQATITGATAALNMLYSRSLTSSVWAKLYSRELIAGIRFDPDLRLAEDLKFNWHALHLARNVAVIPDVVYIYHEEPHSATRGLTSVKSLDTLDALESIDAGLQKERAVAIETRIWLEALQLLTRTSGRRVGSGGSKVRERCLAVVVTGRRRVLFDTNAQVWLRMAGGMALLSPKLTVSMYRGAHRVKRVAANVRNLL